MTAPQPPEQPDPAVPQPDSAVAQPDPAVAQPDPAVAQPDPAVAPLAPPTYTGQVVPQFATPPAPGGPQAFDDPDARKARFRRGVLGAVVGLGVNILVVIVAVVLGLSGSSGTTGTDRWMGMQILLLAGLVLVVPVLVIIGIIMASIRNTRPFGVGLLIGSAIGAIITAGACFAPLAAAG